MCFHIYEKGLPYVENPCSCVEIKKIHEEMQLLPQPCVKGEPAALIFQGKDHRYPRAREGAQCLNKTSVEVENHQNSLVVQLKQFHILYSKFSTCPITYKGPPNQIKIRRQSHWHPLQGISISKNPPAFLLISTPLRLFPSITSYGVLSSRARVCATISVPCSDGDLVTYPLP